MTEIRKRHRLSGFLCITALREVFILTSVVGIALTILWQVNVSLQSHLSSQWRDLKGDAKAVMALSIDREQGKLLILNWPGDLSQIALESGLTAPQRSSRNLVSAVTSEINSTIVMLAEWAEDYQVRHRIDILKEGELQLSEELMLVPTSFVSIGVSADGQVAMLFSGEGQVVGWDLSETEWKRWEFNLNTSTPRCRLSPDGRRLLVAPNEGNLFLCDARTGTRLFEMSAPGNDIRSIAWSDDGNRLVVSEQMGEIHAFETEQGTCIWQGRIHFEFARSVALSSDGHQLAAGGFDNIIRVWDLSQPGNPPLELKGQKGVIRCLSFAQKQTEETLISGSLDGTIHEWSLVTGRSIRQLQ